jgi:hypothetical protein
MVMDHRWLVFAVVLLAGCGQEPPVEARYEPPARTDTRFERLPLVLQGIQKTGDVSLYEGLPSEFWEPELRAQERKQKKTIDLHGYPFYEEQLVLQGKDAEQLSILLSAKTSFQRYRGSKPCGGYQPDYCLQWKSNSTVTYVLISLECGEVKIFGPKGELYCDLSSGADRTLEQLLGSYRKNRPATVSTP